VTGPADHNAARAARLQAEADKQVAKFTRAARGLVPRTCPICGYKGRFTPFGHPPRFDARCGGCQSLERHRLFALWMDRDEGIRPSHAVLHFAPEVQLTPRIRAACGRYETADLSDRRPVTHRINIEDTGLPDAGFDVIICNHVLEHVDDAKALAEMRRLLRPGGRALLMTPVIEGWATTYENPAITTGPERLVHFGQADHVRVYGRDLRDRIRNAGFTLTEYTAVEPDVLTYGLVRGETLFIATKSD
jgi:SAM-dependent methyltransferase